MEPREPVGRSILPWSVSLSIAKLIRVLIRAAGRSGGTTLPGRILMRLRPDAIARLAKGIPGGSIVVSSTNGKTTTAAMISSILSTAGWDVLHNKAGSNMHWGIATSLLDVADLPERSLGLFEIDEAWVSRLIPQLDPRLVVLGNLFRDQLDRYGELERLSDEWSSMVTALPDGCRLALCADDPAIADLASSLPPDRQPVWFGLDDESQALSEAPHAFDAKYCRRCGARYVYRSIFLGHLGDYVCAECGHGRPEALQVEAREIELEGLAGSRFLLSTSNGSSEVNLPLPGLYNVYNGLAAAAAAQAMGVSLKDTVEGISKTAAVFGRSETIEIGSGRLALLLIKNPTGANEVLRTLSQESERVGKLDVWLGLNDRIADGRDISWIWDADFELLAGRVGGVTCSGTRAPEMAERLKYAGWPSDSIEIDEDLERSLLFATERAEGLLYAMPTYTALLEVRGKLAGRGHASDFWE